MTGYLVDCKSVFHDIARTWKPPTKLTVSQWADEFGVVVTGSEQGRWKTRPPQKAILDAWNQPEIEWIKVKKSARVGWTSILGMVFGYHVHQNPCPQLLVQPTIEDASDWSKENLQPLIEETPVLHGLVSEAKTRDSKTTIRKKHYPGGPLHIVGANSARGFRRISVRIVSFDEPDGYPPSAGNEGDQIKLGAKRSDDYHDRKIAMGSTPTDEGISRIDAEIEDSSKGYYFVACPDCGNEHIRKFRQPDKPVKMRGEIVPVSFLQWPDDEPKKARWVCPGCGVLIGYEHNFKMLRNGYWRGEDWSYRNGKYSFLQSFSGKIGFANYWAAYGYSPNTTPAKMAIEFCEVKNNFEKLKTFVNTTLGEIWKEPGEVVDEDSLQARAYKFAAEVPEGALILTAGVDVQADRIECEVVGWDKDEQSWSIDYQVLFGDITQQQVWDDLSEALSATYKHRSGAELKIAGGCIDSGYMPSTVYQFVKDFNYSHCYAIKGDHGKRPIVEDRHTRLMRLRRRQKGGTTPEIVGVHEAKLLLHRRLKLQKSGPGYCHFPIERDDEFYLQLTAEKINTRYVKGVAIQEFIKIRPRNEALDCRVYAHAALRLINPDFAKWAEFVGQPDYKPAPVKRRRVLSRGI